MAGACAPRLKVAHDGTVPVGSPRCARTVSPGPPVIRGQHPDGHFTVRLHPPKPTPQPVRPLDYGRNPSGKV